LGLPGETSDDEQLIRRISTFSGASAFPRGLRGDTEGLSPTAGAPGGLEQLAGAQGDLASEVRLPPS